MRRALISSASSSAWCGAGGPPRTQYGTRSAGKGRYGRRCRRWRQRLGIGIRGRGEVRLAEHEAQEEPGGEPPQVGGVVDQPGGDAEEDIEPGPEEELREERLGGRGEPAAAAEEKGDEGSEEAENGAGGADARPLRIGVGAEL